MKDKSSLRYFWVTLLNIIITIMSVDLWITAKSLKISIKLYHKSLWKSIKFIHFL